MLLLTKNRSVTSCRMLAFRVVFEYLQLFRLVFNTRFLWVIDTDLWVWKCMYWVLFRFLIWNSGYEIYLDALWGIVAVVLLLVALTVVIAVVLKKDDSSNPWLKRLIWFVQSAGLLAFSVAWVSLFDYMVFMFTCHWGAGNNHVKWGDHSCLTVPHLSNMIVAGVTAAIMAVAVVFLAMAECSGNLLSNNLLASPVAETALKVTLLKLVMVLVSTCLDEFKKIQAVLMFICPVLSTYFQITSSPYLLPWMNHLWTGLWTGLVYTTSLLLALNFVQLEEPLDYEEPSRFMAFRLSMTYAVLWGIWPAILLGAAVSHFVYKWRLSPLKHFKAAQQLAEQGKLQLETVAALKSIYRFHSPGQVEFLARCVHAFDPVTDTPLPDAAALGGLVVQAGMARFPTDPSVLLLYSNYIIYVRKQPRAARQQLQLAAKHEPSNIDRYGIFCAMDTLKKSRSDGDSGLDLMAYVDMQRQIRACMKAHKVALLSQRAFWRCVMRDSLCLADVLDSLQAMQQAEQTATYVYKRCGAVVIWA
ncbi:hypothetical protein OEZ86_002065 [Tetradesmus obliquus]|nr:hypothetical protein OEZ86_002065 [Tetradesmus obliquus]